MLRIPTRPGYLLGVYILSFTNLVVASLLGSAFGLLNKEIYFLLFQILATGFAIGLWFFFKKPPLFGEWQNKDSSLKKGALPRFFKKYSAIGVLLIFVGIFYLISAWLVVTVPPNTNDSLSTHLNRAAFWLQHGNMLPWPTPNIFNIIYPVNANLVMLWTMLFTRATNPAGFIQWTAALAGAVTIFGIARLLGWHRAASLFAGLLWLTLPEILLQSSTTQLDLVVSTLITISIYLFILGIRKDARSALVLSGLSLGLAIGTKQIALFAIPGIVIFVILIWGSAWERYKKKIITWIISSSIFTMTLGSYIYIQNSFLFHNPLGDSETLSHQVGGNLGNSIQENLFYNSARFFYQSIDFTGLPPTITDNLTSAKSRLMEPVFKGLGFDLESPIAIHDSHHFFRYMDNPAIQEDTAWYGVIGFSLLITLIVFETIIGIRRKDLFRIGLILIALTYSLLVIGFRPGWDPFQGRYFIFVVMILAPFFADIARPKLGWQILDWVLVVLAVIIMTNTIISNSGKPLLSYPRAQALLKPYLAGLGDQQRERMIALINYNLPNQRDIRDSKFSGRQLFQSGMMVAPVNLVSTHVPGDAALAIGFTTNYPVLPFFGEHLTRKLYPVFPPDMLLDKSWFLDNKIDFLILDLSDPQMPEPPEWLIPYATKGDWALYYPEWNQPPTP